MGKSKNPGIISKAMTAAADSVNFKKKKAIREAKKAGQEAGLSYLTSGDTKKLFGTIGIDATIPKDSTIILSFVGDLTIADVPGVIKFCVPNKNHEIVVKDAKGKLVQRIPKSALSGDGSILVDPNGTLMSLDIVKKDV